MKERIPSLLVAIEIKCDCGHLPDEHYSIEGDEGLLKRAHCEVDACPCELFETEHV